MSRRFQFRLAPGLRLQYGLRSLLLGTLAVAIALGWYVERVRKQKLAVAALTELGAEVVYYDSSVPQGFVDDIWSFESPPTVGEWVERSLPDRLREPLGTDFFRGVDEVRGDGVALVHCCDLHGLRALRLGEVLDEDLANVGALADLKRLEIEDSLLSDTALATIGEFHNLKCLQLTNVGSRLRRIQINCARLPKPITGAGLAHLANLRHLKNLRLENSAVTDASLIHLAQMSDLEILYLSGTKVTDDGLAHLACLRRLTSLDLSDTAVGDAGMVDLAKLMALEVLQLQGTLVTDRGLASLATLKSLRRLDLTHTAVTDKGLRLLGDMPSLESLSVDDNAAVREGAAWLKRRLPRLGVSLEQPEDAELYRAHALMSAGLWREALAALKQLAPCYLGSAEGLSDLGCCHAQLGHHDEAARQYCAALDQVSSTTSPFDVLYPHSVQWLWFELFELPQTFERVARLREHDAERWLATARRAALEGQWSAASEDYRRAIERSSNPDHLTIHEEWFEYGVLQLLAGDMAESRRFQERFFDEDRRAMQTAPGGKVSEKSILFWLEKGCWYAGTRLALLAPQGEVSAAQVAEWREDVGASLWKTSGLLPLVYYREGKFEEVLEQEPPAASSFEPHYVDARFWFPRAMAHRYLGQLAQARECYSKGVRWLDRSRKIARIRGDYDAAGDFLEAETLRRDAEGLIFK